MVLQNQFYDRNTIDVAKDLLGKHLCVMHNGEMLSGIINETEAYHGFDDDACHAHKGVTPRCEVMFGSAGHAYVYFTYGMHYMLNLVTMEKGFPGAVLVRSVIPCDGLDIMSSNRFGVEYGELSGVKMKILSNGPGKLTKALGIVRDVHNGMSLQQDNGIWVEDRGVKVDKVEVTPRIGVDYAQNAREWPWRFVAVDITVS